MNKIVYVDFDGVLNDYKGWQGKENLFKPRKNVEYFLKILSESHSIYIFTAREPAQVLLWLDKYNLLHYINTVTNVKGPAYVYIDDRAIKFDGNYNEVLVSLKDFKPYWQANIKRIK